MAKSADVIYTASATVQSLSNSLQSFNQSVEIDLTRLHAPDYDGIEVTLKNAKQYNISVGDYFRVAINSPFRHLFTGYITAIKSRLTSNDIQIKVKSDIVKMPETVLGLNVPDPNDSWITQLQTAAASLPHQTWSVSWADATALSILSATPNWTTEPTYDSAMLVSDVFHDIFLILNALYANTNYLTFYSYNRQITVASSANTQALTLGSVVDIESTTEEEEVTFFRKTQVNDELRLGGAYNFFPGGGPIIDDVLQIYKSESTVKTTENIALLKRISYAGTDFGFITAVRNDGALYQYTCQKIRIVTP